MLSTAVANGQRLTTNPYRKVRQGIAKNAKNT